MGTHEESTREKKRKKRKNTCCLIWGLASPPSTYVPATTNHAHINHVHKAQLRQQPDAHQGDTEKQVLISLYLFLSTALALSQLHLLHQHFIRTHPKTIRSVCFLRCCGC